MTQLDAGLTLSVPNTSISAAAARQLLEAAKAASEGAGLRLAIAVTDHGGHLVAFERMDGVPFLTADVAIDKAWTAASYQRSTHVWNAYVQDPAVAPLGHHPRLLAVAGGYPIVLNGQVIGGLGLSGATAAQDQAAAEEALRALGFEVSA